MTVSKPMTRVVISVLLALALLVAIYSSVQGGLGDKLLKSDANGAQAQAHVVNGLKTNLNHDRSSVAELESAAFQEDSFMRPSGGGHGGCEDEMRVDPNDL